MKHKVVAALAVGTCVGGLLVASIDAQDAKRVSPLVVRLVQSDGKYSLEGPWWIGDPVHETLTLFALRDSDLISASDKFDSPKAREFIRGVFWNDDPCGDLFKSNTSMAKSTGAAWGIAFERAKAGKPPNRCPLLSRSHFGDMQFLHGMATRNGVAAAETQAEVLRWAEFTYRVATGSIADDTKLSRVPIPELSKLLSSAGPKTVAGLFLANSEEVTRTRALGSLLHMIQDSYAGGHARRIESNGRRGAIAQFQCYTDQQKDKHAHDDSWNGGDTDEAKLKLIRGGVDGREGSAKVLGLHKAGKSWDEVKDVFALEIFQLVGSPAASGPGADYQ